MKKLVNYAQDRDGSATVDWIVLAAGVLALTFAIAASLSQKPLTQTAETTPAISSVSGS